MERLVFSAVVLVLVIVTTPWHLEWWKVDTLIGFVLFCFSEFRRGSRASIWDGWLMLSLSAGFFGLALFFATALGVGINDLQSSKAPWRIVRQLPDYAVVCLVFGMCAVLVRSVFGRGKNSI